MSNQTRWQIAVILMLGMFFAVVRVCRADEIVPPAEVAIVAEEVAAELRARDFDVTAGATPEVIITRIDDGNISETRGRDIHIDERMPDACRLRLTAHELTHLLLDRRYGAKRRNDETLAVEMEAVIVPDYQPGCVRIPRGPIFPLGEFTL